jgi:simple sugar transport system permease protein
MDLVLLTLAASATAFATGLGAVPVWFMGARAEALRPILFGTAYSYGSTFQSGLGFAGIAIALLGRNHPIGIALGALLFAFLDEQSNPLQILVGVAPDIVKITQGIIALPSSLMRSCAARRADRATPGSVLERLAGEKAEVSE